MGQAIDWKMGTEAKQIGEYMCFKATAMVSASELTWYDFSWGDLNKSEENDEAMIEVEAWYTLQIPIKQGPAEYWGLPGLILEVSAGNTVMLCSQIVLNTHQTKKKQPKKKKKKQKQKQPHIQKQ